MKNFKLTIKMKNCNWKLELKLKFEIGIEN